MYSRIKFFIQRCKQANQACGSGQKTVATWNSVMTFSSKRKRRR